MKLGIVTDSSCDLPQYLIEEHGIEVVPAVLIMDGVEYLDGNDLGHAEFYQRLPALKKTPSTASPSIGEFARRYQEMLMKGCDAIVSVHAAGALTSIVSTAGQAAKEFPNKVTVVDSLSLSLGLGFQVLAAAEAVEEGLQAALAAIESTRRRLHLFAALDALEYVRRSGRVPAALSILGGMLRIKPIIEVSQGAVKTIEVVRTTKQANERLNQFFRLGNRYERLAIMHTGAETRAREFLNELMSQVSQSLPRDILLVNATPVIGVHIGPNALGFAAVGA